MSPPERPRHPSSFSNASSGRGTQLEKLYYRIGEVAGIVGVEPHVLRYWETEFRSVRPQKSARGQRIYSRRDVDTLLKVKELLYGHRFTIAGAKQKLREGGVVEPAAAPAPAPEPAAPPAPNGAAQKATAGPSFEELKAIREDLVELRRLAESFLEELFEDAPVRAPLQRAK